MERKELLVVVLIGLVLVTTAIQTVQLVSLGSGEISTIRAAAPAPTVAAGDGGGEPQVPTSLQNLPSMVGGC